jgi:stress-induced-phosphoprotein 1
LIELGQFDEAVKVATETVELARKIHADFKLIARALERMGNALLRQDKPEEALECFRKSVTEFRNPEVLKKIKNVEADLKKKAEMDYVDVEIALEEKEKGNVFFRSGDFASAIERYKEAILRNPEEHTLYNNLAAAYIKVGEFREALEASEKCLEMKPDFVKGYARKGKALAGMKEYYKALKTFDEGMKLDPSNPELTSESTRVAQLMQREGAVGGDVSDKERLDRAMEDPEIRAILADPMLQLQLKNMQENPALAAQYMKDPSFADKVQKLISAGVIR